MIDHESEIFHSIDAIETLINQLHGMQQRAERFARVAEGHTANGCEYRSFYRDSARMLQAAMNSLASERAVLLQTQIDAIELRRLNGGFAPGVEEILTAEEAIKD